mmetsp:Transcript_11600/g.22499  ORF Transcript_11600/g.22499 Transcript_11600/m.22499 type:complete len:222 (+) Transcript_11600:226-891(+)|eukprot:CAMPEP_0171328436 /NCGR_PEP_ID=MMETSP0878-20121228/652_1 /TAXON_ID=67004 /ORGANISM="Thalassiosira weissflogii, Strain CCMP1336" /LENGTH=221 /DNA_ID=CAMNT_0011828287 /DNA_START=95 /DNA_END=760 /DNA_ORIENTATION=-
MFGTSITLLSSIVAYASPAMAFSGDGITGRSIRSGRHLQDLDSPVIMHSLRDIASEMDSWMDDRVRMGGDRRMGMDMQMDMDMGMGMDMRMDIDRRHHPRNMGPRGPQDGPQGEQFFEPSWGGPEGRPPFDRQFDYDPMNPRFDPVWTQSTPSVRDDRRNEGFMDRSMGRNQGFMDRSMDDRRNEGFMNRPMRGPYEDEPFGFEQWGEGSFYPDRQFGYGP